MKCKIFAVLVLVSFCFSNLFSQSLLWESPYIGSSKDVLYLPDANAVYWRYGWERMEGDVNGFVVKGQMPNARYFSYNLYDDVTKSSLGSLTDFNIKFDNTNSYTLYIVPEGTKIDKENVLFFNKKLTKLSVVLRHYLPQGNIYGNVEMPKISKYDSANGLLTLASESAKVPKFSKEDVEKYLIPMFNKFMENPEENLNKLIHRTKDKPLNVEELICKQVVSGAFAFFNKDKVIYSFNLNSDGTYPNNDNHYLTMPVVRTNNDVLFIKFKAPIFPKNKDEFSSSDVRYFSISQGDELTYNYKTIADYEFKINSDGYIYLIIGNESDELVEKAKQLNVNFMPWLVNEKMLLIYRNMLPNTNFKNGANAVVKFDKNKPVKDQLASRFIGSFAPTGFLFKYDVFLKFDTIPNF